MSGIVCMFHTIKVVSRLGRLYEQDQSNGLWLLSTPEGSKSNSLVVNGDCTNSVASRN